MDSPGTASPQQMYYLKSKGKLTFARGYADSTPKAPRRLREQLLEEKVLVVEDDERLRLTQAYTFTHPSPAASVMVGYSVSGMNKWKGDDGRSLADVREAEALEVAENP